ncbi:MAG TPA: two-component regulator propeller domain-containing protein [Acidobacteriota bacterium]|nr:two-component regulator propeller domain-containing protein [Acidobacteriota bacterium]
MRILFCGLFGLILILTCGTTPVFGLDPAKAITQYNQRVWQDGLPHTSVTTIVQTRDGYIWLGTYEGLVRFNGFDFTAFDSRNTPAFSVNGILTLVEGQDGSLWIGTNGGGVVRYSQGRFSTYSTLQGLSNNYIFCTTLDKSGNLWVGTDGGGVNCIQANGTITKITSKDGLSSDYVRSLTVDSKGVLWVGTTNGGLNRIHNGTITVYTTREGLADNSLLSLFETRDGVLWIGTGRGGLCSFKDDKLETLNVTSGVLSDPILSFLEDRDGNFWIGSGGSGLLRFSNGKLSVFTMKEDLPNNVVRALWEDREGNLWAGTDGGLVRFKDGKLTTFGTKEGLSSNDTRAIFEDSQHRIWVGTIGGGLNCYEKGVWRAYTTQDGLGRNIVRALCEDKDGNLWVGTDVGGLCRFRDGKFTVYTTANGLNHNTIRALCVDHEGTLWVGTYGGGINRYRDGVFTSVTTENGLARNVIFAIYEAHDHTLWISTFGGGVTCVKDGKYSTLTTKDGLASDQVWSFHEDADGVMWIATNAGISRYRDGKFTSINSKDGLINDAVFQILEDNLGRLWGSGSRGVFSINRQALADYLDKKISQLPVLAYGKSDGMASSQCTAAAYPAGFKAHDGRLWFPTTGGVSMVNPASIKLNETPPPVIIEKFIVDLQPVERADSLVLSPGKNKFEFHFAGLSFAAPEKVRFQYWLEGYDRDWVEAGTLTRAYYTNLPPRAYQFRVRACNNDGIWNETGDVLKFTLKPYFYQTTWAYLLFFGSILGLVVGGVRLRLNSLKRHNEELEAKVRERTARLAETIDQLKLSEHEIQRKATELAETVEKLQLSERQALTAKEDAIQSEKKALDANRAKSTFLANMSHELRTPLNAILGFVQIMQRRPLRDHEDQENLSIILRSGEHLLGLINDVLSISKIEVGKITLSEQPFDLQKLLQTLQEMFRVRTQAKNLMLFFEIDPSVPQFVHGDEGKLRQILINLLGNAVKFTESGGITLRARWSGGMTHFEVQDTGVGIAPEELSKLFEPFVQTRSGQKSAEGTGLGLAISSNFARLMGGEITVRSTYGKGSVFSFAVELERVSGELVRNEERRVIGLAPGSPPYRVLVVDDKFENRALLLKLLIPIGFQLREAVNGKEAVEMAAEWNPHLIWMDIRMPVMDGYEATRKIREQEQESNQRLAATNGQFHRKIIALSASVFEHDREAIFAAGCDDFLPKPFRENEAFDKMAHHLGITYVFDCEGETAPPSTPASGEIRVDDLARLPLVEIQKLSHALTIGDTEAATRLIEAIRHLNPELAVELTAMVRNYQFDEILDLVEQVEKSE